MGVFWWRLSARLQQSAIVLGSRLRAAARLTARLAAIGVATIIASGCAGYVSPPGAVSPDRPGFTDTPPVMPASAFQLEAGYTDDRTDAGTYATLGEVLLRIGVGAQSEIRLFGNSLAIRSAPGVASTTGRGDQKLGFKTNLCTKPDSVHSLLPNVAFLAATTVPTGSDGFTASRAQPEAKLAVNWTTASPFSLYSNVGVGSIYNEVGRAGRLWVSTAGWWSVNPKVSAFVEGMTMGRLSGSGSGTAGNWVDGGLTYLINDRLQLDARAGHGLGSETSTERFFGVGFARRW